MGKYLLVANQTLGGEHLIEEVRRQAAAGPSAFYVVVPNTRAVDAARASGAPLAPAAVMSGSSEDEDHRASYRNDAQGLVRRVEDEGSPQRCGPPAAR